MKKLVLVLLASLSLNVLAQVPPRESSMQSSSTAVAAEQNRRRVPCCAQCSGPNAHLNASILDTTTKPPSCKPQNGNGNGNQPWQVVYVKNCTNRVVPGHKACGGSSDD